MRHDSTVQPDNIGTCWDLNELFEVLVRPNPGRWRRAEQWMMHTSESHSTSVSKSQTAFRTLRSTGRPVVQYLGETASVPVAEE